MYNKPFATYLHTDQYHHKCVNHTSHLSDVFLIFTKALLVNTNLTDLYLVQTYMH